MSEAEKQDRIQSPPPTDTVTSTTMKIIKDIQETRKSKLLVLLSQRPIDGSVALALNGVLRRMGEVENLDVLLDSGGGDLDSAYKVLLLLKSYAKTVTIIVPFYAKSAATLIALGADCLQMCKAGELGPLDPQVWDHASGQWVPALSVRKAIDFITSVDKAVIEVSLADKMSPLLMGAYRIAEESSKQYLNEIFAPKKIDDAQREKIVKVFTENLRSHGYPISRDYLKELGVPVKELTDTEENLFTDLHEIIIKDCVDLNSKHPEQKGQILMLQSDDINLIRVGSINIAQPE